MKRKVINKRGSKTTSYVIVIPLLLFCFTLMFGVLQTWAVVDKEAIKPKLAKICIPFIENQGQIKDASVKFYANTFAGTVFLTEKGEVVYSLRSESGGQESVTANKTMRSQKAEFLSDAKNSKQTKGWIISESFSNPDPKSLIKVQGIDKAKTSVNYFIGNKKENWRRNIPSYNSVTLGKIYDGIELKLKAYGKNVEKVFIVNPGADVSKIEMSLKGAKSIKINKSGEIEAETGIGTLRFTKPYAYQEIEGKKVEIAASYTIRTSEPRTPNSLLSYGFELASYDKKYPIIIDPSTFIGGSGNDEGRSIAISPLGLDNNVYVTGWTDSLDYPTTPGAYDITYNGGTSDVFVSKLDRNLANLLASTYIGGSSDDRGFSIAIRVVHNLEFIYVTGRTESADYPTTPRAYDRIYNGGMDVFVSKLDSNLANLLASTYIGGSIDSSMIPNSGDEGGHDIAIGYWNNAYVYVTGWTDSLDYPTTPGAYDGTYNGGISDVFVSKLDTNLTILLASTYVGGSYTDGGNSISIDSHGVFITGYTESANYPTTPRAYDIIYNGNGDAFVTGLDWNLGRLLASTFIGGRNYDEGYSIARWGGSLFITGVTESPNYPTTARAYDTTCGTDGNCNFDGSTYYSDVFVSRLTKNLRTLLASTFIGGSDADIGFSIARDPTFRFLVTDCRGIYITGWTDSFDYPTTPGALDPTYNGNGDVFVSGLSVAFLSALNFSTYIGGSESDTGWSIAIRRAGRFTNRDLFVTGSTFSLDYPTTLGAYDITYNGGISDAFVSRSGCNLSGL